MSDSPMNPFEDPPTSQPTSPPNLTSPSNSQLGAPPFSAPIPSPPGTPHGPPPGYVAYDAYGTFSQQALATAGRRIVARIIDSLILFALFFVVAVVALGSSLRFAGVGTSGVTAFQILVLLVITLWEAAFLSTKGATPGKMAMSVKVVYEDGGDLDFRGALMRLAPNIVLGLMALIPALVGLSSFFNFVITIVSLVFLFSSDRRQTVWDRIAKTIVIKN